MGNSEPFDTAVNDIADPSGRENKEEDMERWGFSKWN